LRTAVLESRHMVTLPLALGLGDQSTNVEAHASPMSNDQHFMHSSSTHTGSWVPGLDSCTMGQHGGEVCATPVLPILAQRAAAGV